MDNDFLFGKKSKPKKKRKKAESVVPTISSATATGKGGDEAAGETPKRALLLNTTAVSVGSKVVPHFLLRQGDRVLLDPAHCIKKSTAGDGCRV